MNEPESLEPKTHQHATLLPWYLSNTLDHEEKRDIEAHLTKCETCQMELDEMKRARLAIKAAVTEREGPSPAVLTKVMARIREDKVAIPETTRPMVEESPNLWAQLEAWFQSLFAVPWVPVLATALIVGQSALLLTNLSGPGGSIPPGQDSGPVIERGIPTAPTPAPSPTPSTKLFVVFVDTATQGTIQALLQNMQAQVISGPSSDGIYTLEIPTTDPDEVQTLLQTLLKQSEVIHSVKTSTP